MYNIYLLEHIVLVGLVYLDSVAFNGVGANLVVFLQSILHESSASSAANASTWSGTTYFASLVGAVIADSCWGNFKTIKISLIIYLLVC